MLDVFGSSETGTAGTRAGSDAETFTVDDRTTVLDDDLRPVTPGSGVVGRLARQGHVPLGYYKDEAKTRATFAEVDGQPLGHARRQATVDADGTVRLLGRGSGCINTGGEKVFPEEVEAVLKGHPDVLDTLVVGVPDERWGATVAAVVQTRPGTPIPLEELQAHARVGTGRLQAAPPGRPRGPGRPRTERQARLRLGFRRGRGGAVVIERFSGTDALLWHMERPESPMHTIKTTIVDPARRGAPLTLDDIEEGIAQQVGLVPRLGQRVVAARWFPGRPFWVTDPQFVVADHLDEVVAEPPGDRLALDTVHTQLASLSLDLDRPLWSLTLVHGLEGGRQALVVRIHHAILDGGAALNGLLALTGEEPGARPNLVPPPAAVEVTDVELRRRVVRGVPATRCPPGPAGARWAPRRSENEGLPRGASRSAGADRMHRATSSTSNSTIPAVCASIDLDLARHPSDRQSSGGHGQRGLPLADRRCVAGGARDARRGSGSQHGVLRDLGR